MSLTIIYNACGLSGRDNSDFYIKNVRSILNQDLENKRVVFSGHHIPPKVFEKVINEFGREITYCLTKGRLAVNQSFNHSVLKSVENYGESDGYMYVASDVTFSEDSKALSRLYERTKNPENGIISPEIDKDNGYYWWFNFDQTENLWDVFGRDKDFVVPLGATANIHCKIFSNKIFKEYGRVLPDVFVSYCTETIFSFLAASVQQRFIIANDVTFQHANHVPGAGHHGLDGQTLSYGAAWDRLFPGTPKTISEIISDPKAAASGLGYEEWAPPFIEKGECPADKPHLMHDSSKFDKNGYSLNNDLRDFIKENFFLKQNVLDYDKIENIFF